MKILIVAEDFPWPSTGGGLLRLAKFIEAISHLGETDLFTLYDASRTDIVVPPRVPLNRLETARYPRAPSQLRWRAAWLAQRGLPLEVVMRRGDSRPRIAFEAWASDCYDVVWFSTAATFAWMGRPCLGPTIIDLMDLEDEKARQRAALLRTQRRTGGPCTSIRLTAAATQAHKNAGDWRSFQHSVASEVERVVLCSDIDVQRSGLPNALAIPNAYPKPARSVGHVPVGDPPVILLQGSLRYAPNIDAVEWLIEQIAPRLWEEFPSAQIRLVGKPTRAVEARHRPPSVTVVGSVPDMEPELERADIAVVPLRIGSGTRLKILESFAHRVPVVSTSLGAEGLDVQDGVHLLLADDAGTFATACQRLLRDPDLRKRLVDAAEELYLQRYEWSAAKDQLQQLVRDVAEAPTIT
jgi:glycosyltransferase involved in cell wall biosynthesis